MTQQNKKHTAYIKRCIAAGFAEDDIRLDGSAKVCFACNKQKPASEFGKHKHSSFGLLFVCKPCNTIRNTNYRKQKQGAK